MRSRIARKPIEIPAGVEVKQADQIVTFKGKLGEMTQAIHPAIRVEQNDNLLQINLAEPVQPEANALAGTMRALLQNHVTGVSKGFERKLTLVGVGYRAKVQGNSIDINVGYSHPVKFDLPEGVSAQTPSQTEIVLSGVDKQKVCQVAANIRSIRPPEPYKGKGIRYSDEIIIRKEGKKK